ncbi:UNVERIFIED_CONTAM: hypothetical protein FKN15_059131 [Acipenser sinensis]
MVSERGITMPPGTQAKEEYCGTTCFLEEKMGRRRQQQQQQQQAEPPAPKREEAEYYPSSEEMMEWVTDSAWNWEDIPMVVDLLWGRDGDRWEHWDQHHYPANPATVVINYMAAVMGLPQQVEFQGRLPGAPTARGRLHAAPASINKGRSGAPAAALLAGGSHSTVTSRGSASAVALRGSAAAISYGGTAPALSRSSRGCLCCTD